VPISQIGRYQGAESIGSSSSLSSKATFPPPLLSYSCITADKSTGNSENNIITERHTHTVFNHRRRDRSYADDGKDLVRSERTRRPGKKPTKTANWKRIFACRLCKQSLDPYWTTFDSHFGCYTMKTRRGMVEKSG